MGFFKKKNFMTKYFYLSLNSGPSLMCIYSSKNGFSFFLLERVIVGFLINLWIMDTV